MSTRSPLIRAFVTILLLFFSISPGNTIAADQFGSLAVAVPYEKLGEAENAGVVNIIRGSSQGLSSSDNQMFYEDSYETNDFFGIALASGDFNNDGFPDLAASAPYKNIDGFDGAGTVNIFYGTSDGLSKEGGQIWHQNVPDIDGAAEDDDQFGKALASGDFNNDGFSDLAIGVPWEDIGAVDMAGAVNIIYGSKQGLSSDNDQFLYQGNGIVGIPEPADMFGGELATGDFNKDGFTDLAVGILGQTVNGKVLAGAVHIIYGSALGLTSDNNHVLSQGNGIEETAEESDFFGSALASGDFNRDGYGDLAIGAPYEDRRFQWLFVRPDAGVVHVIYGSEQGLSSVGNDLWQQGTDGIVDDFEGGDQFGKALTTGDFNRDGFADLAVGVPFEDSSVPVTDGVGAVNIIYGSEQGLTSTDNQIHWQENGIAGSNFGSSLAAGDINDDSFADLAIGAPYDDPDALNNAGTITILFGSAQGISAVNSLLRRQGEDGVSGTAEANDRFGKYLAYLPPARSFPWAMFLPAITAGARTSAPTPNPDPFSISSTSFGNNQAIPINHTLHGANISPQLSWEHAPAATESILLTVMDPDGGNWLHWKVELPGTTTSLAENAGAAGGANLPPGSIRYPNEFKNWPVAGSNGTDYDGPDPGVGSGVHHYIFKITALDAGSNELGSATLTGTYEQL
jgi:Raf kinase inhibitor-like YbhB/YbcL family protein